MKHYYLSILLLFAGLIANAQSGMATGKNTDSKIREVYGNQTETMIMNDKDRKQLLADMLQTRAILVNQAESSSEKFPKISSVPLFNKYNPELERDTTGPAFNPDTFNVLKYKIPLTANRTLVYRIDGTNYLLVVNPQIVAKS
ncbi:hypothetical protein [Flavobacterium silvaticum]|uniref:Uncharacterized protein n=1 Tax=Flavobacterium silvaticum TaxID=1852020 RepID=A0A972JIA1_9FLAO|nr:hypothetical protein [Flavobacterium silvaticum]NMH28785.1 hypothetical protein [Flavobacterium silvaticum]